ncbi:tol-pal system protein YbgF [Megalodesulfovibrio gigas]|uniref:Putative tol-pal system protein n=1 Tax=Megalodesulfovibrio gigas (strain ATCC 19364 / DSM 1382 / NCIMB 9332 / VKM B-1759) TaxID=1121448 RepID=T2GF03_MEGG1|nr:tol-pal system protein YbgF [Megalodesulfovibrio gigas]AGW14507.1 putative tol-pal system protein [Megalodesulfovibrio gigas DSM 1382 = ATCC 19364]
MSHSKRRTMPTVTVLALAGLALASCTGKEIDALNARVAALEQRMNSLEEIRPNQANMSAEIDVLRADVNMLRGKADEFDRRFKAPPVETLPAFAPPLNATTPLPGLAPSLTPGQPQGLSPSQAAELGAPSAVLAPATPPMPRNQVVSESDEPAAAPGADPAQAAYNEARAQFNARNYQAAQAMWEQFVNAHPTHELASNAIFWQGEAFFQLKEYPKAILAYQEIISKHSDTPKAAAAYLKQGIAFIQIGKTKAGQVQLQHVIHKYPNTPEAKRAMEYLKSPN